MFLLQSSFWMRTFTTSFAIAIAGFGLTILGGWGPCGPSHAWQFYGLLAGLPSLAIAILSLVALTLSKAIGFVSGGLRGR